MNGPEKEQLILKCGSCEVEVDAINFDEDWKKERKQALADGAVWYCFACTLRDLASDTLDLV